MPTFYYDTNSQSQVNGKVTHRVYETKIDELSIHRPIYYINRNMGDVQKTEVVNQIARNVLSVGTKGADQDATFASFVAHIDPKYSYFKKGDKALVYIITDEDDSSSIKSLSAPNLTVKNQTIKYDSQPGIYYYKEIYQSVMTCPRYKENGEPSEEFDQNIFRQFATIDECKSWINSPTGITRQDCKNLACQKYTTGHSQALGQSQSVESACAAVKQNKTNVTKCEAREYTDRTFCLK